MNPNWGSAGLLGYLSIEVNEDFFFFLPNLYLMFYKEHIAFVCCVLFFKMFINLLLFHLGLLKTSSKYLIIFKGSFPFKFSKKEGN